MMLSEYKKSKNFGLLWYGDVASKKLNLNDLPKLGK